MGVGQPGEPCVIGARIRAHREALGLSQAELARRVYVSRQTVGNWESGRTLADVQSLVFLANVFGVSVDELVGGAARSRRARARRTAMRSCSCSLRQGRSWGQRFCSSLRHTWSRLWARGTSRPTPFESPSTLPPWHVRACSPSAPCRTYVRSRKTAASQTRLLSQHTWKGETRAIRRRATSSSDASSPIGSSGSWRSPSPPSRPLASSLPSVGRRP